MIDVSVESQALYLNYRGCGYGPYFTVDSIKKKQDELTDRDEHRFGSGHVFALKNVKIRGRKMVAFKHT